MELGNGSVVTDTKEYRVIDYEIYPMEYCDDPMGVIKTIETGLDGRGWGFDEEMFLLRHEPGTFVLAYRSNRGEGILALEVR